MAKILLRLRMAPDDEAQDVRDLLDKHSIPWFETTAGRFGVSFPAIWLRDDDDFDRAKTLLDQYQEQRRINARAQFDQQVQEGRAETFLSRLLSHPLQIVFILAAVVIIAYFSIVPFFSLLAS